MKNHSRWESGHSLWVVLPRFLYANLGIRRGVGRVMMAIARRYTPLQLVPVRLQDGRIIEVDVSQQMCIPYLLTGLIPTEVGETKFVRAMIRPGETVLDIGANMGWYSTLMCELVGPDGRVFAFEPNPSAFRLLVATAARFPQLRVLQVALGDQEGEAIINIPEDGAAASLRELRDRETIAQVRCVQDTLDNIVNKENICDISFIKLDVERFEMEVLRGAEKLLSKPYPPLWLAEINEQARFGNDPERLIDFFARRGFTGYWIESRSGELRALPHRAPFKHDAVFVPPWLEDRVASYREQHSRT